MNPRKLAKLRQEIEDLRRRLTTIKGRELESIAKKLGRRLAGGQASRGKEPPWISDELPDRNAVTIPRHGGNKDFKPKTAKNILEQFELDLDELEEKYGTE
ncbi:MAG: type II toxin-antitoxin system HicA family toxin [Actinomycetota bacterium]|nr:type II toxin-antitoxin system HicA family toxin [Actinomycetota bacterium]